MKLPEYNKIQIIFLESASLNDATLKSSLRNGGAKLD